MDNAVGVAALIEVARRLHATGYRGRRSLVFLAVTGEEMGLLGSRYYVTRAMQRRTRLVADINSDMFLPLFPLKRLIVFGLEESELGADVRAVAGSMAIEVQTDPEPLRNRFIRSDQYSFIRVGIPSLALKLGFDLNSPEADIERKWFAERYHAPADDLSQPVDLGAIAQFTQLLETLAIRVADRDESPQWNASSAFAHLAPEPATDRRR
jgi:Zn-dependent M28 family amino/carboxypeptidase